MEYAFSFQKVLDGNGIKISITGMVIVFFVLLTITISLLLLPKILMIVNKFFPDKEEEEIVSNSFDKEKEIVAAIGYALLKSK